jgi:hypothetical protein
MILEQIILKEKSTMAEFMIVMKGAYKEWCSVNEVEKKVIMEKYNNFVGRLVAEQRFKGGSALKHGAVQLKSEKGTTIIDGPFAETKEALNGYFIFEAQSFEDAILIARECPALTHGETVEVFELTSH